VVPSVGGAQLLKAAAREESAWQVWSGDNRPPRPGSSLRQGMSSVRSFSVAGKGKHVWGSGKLLS
jgi:hypothetical protein